MPIITGNPTIVTATLSQNTRLLCIFFISDHTKYKAEVLTSILRCSILRFKILKNNIYTLYETRL
jgi:hypothetical protein